MQFRYNSTIGIKSKACKSCGRVGPIFSKGRCAQCAKVEDVMKRMEKETDKIIQSEDLSELIKDADALFSRFIRLSVADQFGISECYICRKKLRWQDAQCMHYISRASLYLRYDIKNCKSGCKECNEYKGGNLIEYGKRLESEYPGVTEILYQDGHIVYKFTREELKQIIVEFTQKLSEIGSKNRNTSGA